MNSYENLVCHILNIRYDTLKRVLGEHNYRTFKVPKKSGGYRNISAPHICLKNVQESLAQYIDKKYEFLDCQYGFIKNRSIVDNAVLHKKAKYILNIDLKNFFPSINFGRVRGIFMAKPFNFPKEVATILAKISCYHNELPQGSPCSPSLSNIVCYTLDQKMMNMSVQYGFTYSRYADDITISSDRPFPKEIVTRTKDNIVIVGKKLRHIIESQGFIINEDKTNYSWNNERKEVTGLIVNEKVNVKKIYVKQLRALLNNIDKEGLYFTAKKYFKCENISLNASQRKKLIKKLRNIVEGRLNFLSMVRGADDLVYQKYLEKYLDILHKENLYSPSLRKKLKI